MGGAICASLVFHTLVFLVLSETSLYYPAFGTPHSFEILWIFPGSAPVTLPATDEANTPSTSSANSAHPPLLPDPDGDEPASTIPQPDAGTDEGSPVAKDSVRETFQDIEEPAEVTLAPSQQAVARLVSAKAVKPDKQTADPQDERKRTEAFQHLQNEQSLALAERMEREAEQERMTQQQNARREEEARTLKAAERARLEGMELEAEQERTAQQQNARREEEARTLKAAERARLERMEREAEQERMAQQQNARREEEARMLKAAERARLERMEREAEQERMAQLQRRKQEMEALELKAERARLELPGKEPAQPERSARLAVERRASAMVEKPNEQDPLATQTSGGSGSLAPPIRTEPASPVAPATTETTGPKPSQEPQEKRGGLFPAVNGDLKLVIAGDDALRVLVSFTAYPKSSRSRPITKSEARRVQKIAPVFGKTVEGTREAVIETAREGVYVFRVEPRAGKTATASFTLKIFESTGKKKIKQLGSRRISEKAVLLKILMPEAILWEDESAFTGSMEDSESVFRFNAETGLYWKEYKDVE